MDKLLCNHERQYCREKKSKFFKTEFGEIVVGKPDPTFQNHLYMKKNKVYAFRNQGLSKKRHREIVNKSHIIPFAVDIKNKNWSGEMGVYWR